MQSVWIGIWSWFGGSWSRIKRKKWKKWQKKSWKTVFFHFAWTCGKFAQSCEMDQKRIWLRLKGKTGNWFRMTMRKFRTIVQNCIFFPDFFVKKVFGRPLRWCQVSTWPWPINRNLIYSFKGDIHTFSNCKIFQIFSL